MTIQKDMSLYDAIREYKEAKVVTANRLKESLLEAILDLGLTDLEETTVAVVKGNEIVFTAYVCQDSDNSVRFLTVEDIELGGDITGSSTVRQDSLVLYC